VELPPYQTKRRIAQVISFEIGRQEFGERGWSKIEKACLQAKIDMHKVVIEINHLETEIVTTMKKKLKLVDLSKITAHNISKMSTE